MIIVPSYLNRGTLINQYGSVPSENVSLLLPVRNSAYVSQSRVNDTHPNRHRSYSVDQQTKMQDWKINTLQAQNMYM